MTNASAGAAEGDLPVVLVAVEPRLYASALGRAIGKLRPGLELRVVEPDDLEAEVPRLDPSLVLCSQPRGRPCRGGGPAWVEFYPYAGAPPKVRVRSSGRCSTLEDVDLEDLLRIIDSRGLWPVFREGGIGQDRHLPYRNGDPGRREIRKQRKPGAK